MRLLHTMNTIMNRSKYGFETMTWATLLTARYTLHGGDSDKHVDVVNTLNKCAKNSESQPVVGER